MTDSHPADDERDGDGEMDWVDGMDRDERDGPLSDLAAAVDERRRGGAGAGGAGGTDGDDAAARFESAFGAVAVEDVDPAAVWAELRAEDDVAESVAAPATSSRADDAGRHAGRVVPTSLCHRCRFFEEPPAFACSHEGTEIRELVDTDHYSVFECPMVSTHDVDDNGAP